MKSLHTGRGARLIGLGEHRPAAVVTNDDLAAQLDTNDEWIQTRTGITSRRVAGPDESVVSMAVDASRKAIADAGIDPQQVGLVVLATCTMPNQVPGGAAEVALGVGASHAGAVDLNAACAGFCYAVSLAADAVRQGTADYVVVAAAERLSGVVDWTDRASAILFGDGAGAVIVGPADDDSIGPTVWGSDGAAAALIGTTEAGYLRLDGPAVYRWATTSLGPVARRACEVAGVEANQLAALIPHQANLRIVRAVAHAVQAPNAVIADDIVTAGNTSSASIPLAMSALRSRGDVSSGDLALLLGFGAGLTWAGCVVAVP